MKTFYLITPQGPVLVRAKTLTEALNRGYPNRWTLLGAVAAGVPLIPLPRARLSPLTIIIGRPAAKGAPAQ